MESRTCVTPRPPGRHPRTLSPAACTRSEVICWRQAESETFSRITLVSSLLPAQTLHVHAPATLRPPTPSPPSLSLLHPSQRQLLDHFDPASLHVGPNPLAWPERSPATNALPLGSPAGTATPRPPHDRRLYKRTPARVMVNSTLDAGEAPKQILTLRARAAPCKNILTTPRSQETTRRRGTPT